jgi:hypothetical protein
VLQIVTKYILRTPKKLWDAQLRLILPVGVRAPPPAPPLALRQHDLPGALAFSLGVPGHPWTAVPFAYPCLAAVYAQQRARGAAAPQAFSAFLNNTPIVAMMIPVVNDWARRTKLPVSRLMLVRPDPFSFWGCY